MFWKVSSNHRLVVAERFQSELLGANCLKNTFFLSNRFQIRPVCYSCQDFNFQLQVWIFLTSFSKSSTCLHFDLNVNNRIRGWVIWSGNRLYGTDILKNSCLNTCSFRGESANIWSDRENTEIPGEPAQGNCQKRKRRHVYFCTKW